jgi:ectoine hydroxylase-related dioxygenase (phytanoyl-CoA dioxygenase family)
VKDFIIHDKVLEVMDLTLAPWCDNYQLNSNSITAIGPDETPQPLHRDDLLYPLAHPSERNACCTTFWALTDFTEENGATRIIPGSHLWDDKRVPQDDETVGAVMSKGSFCIFLGGTYHGGGRNTTRDEWRIAMFTGFALGWLRQEQNWYLSVTPDEVRNMPERLARLLGFNLHKPFLGWVQDFQDPFDVINGYEELSSGGSDLYAEGQDRPTPGARVA